VNEIRRDSVHALSGAYVVDALDDAERAGFEAHLVGCRECQAEVASLREAAAMLADDAAMTPPPSLRANVLAGIRTIRPLPPETGSETGEDSSVGEVEDDRTGENVVPFRRRRFNPRLLAAAAAVLAVVGVGAVVENVRDEPGSSQLPVADQVMAASDAKHVKVSFPDGSVATVVRSESVGKAVLVTQKMAAPPEGKVYELWLRDPSGTMIPAGVMNGAGNQKQVLKGNAADATAAAISVEPAGGSEQPTSEPIAMFDFQQA
jgi:anti-sigma-K factor RskA